nr:putative lipid II flippase FtsW [uncultured Agathobacter sp.]
MAGKRRKQKEKKEKGIPFFDYNLLFIVIFLLCFGLVMLYSSSSYTSANRYHDSMHYLKLQIRNILLGIAVMAVMTAVDYRWWKKLGVAAYVVSFLLCILVFVPGIGTSSHGSSRWIGIGPIQFQPSEVAKIAVIIFMAMIIDKIPKQFTRFSSIIKMFIILAPLIGIVAYSNLSTAIIIIGISVCMMFVASPKYLQFILVGIGVLVFAVAFVMLAGYRSTRIEAWLHPETASSDAVYQTMMGLYAIGSGGLFGKGLGESLQKLGNVPESQNDMIFTIICEELGLFGAICLILLFIILIWRMMVVANNARDLYGSLLVIGVMSHIAIQVILNIAVVTNSIPNTGVILPFISYGGTSIIFLMAEIGIVLSVSRGIRLGKVQ